MVIESIEKSDGWDGIEEGRENRRVEAEVSVSCSSKSSLLSLCLLPSHSSLLSILPLLCSERESKADHPSSSSLLLSASDFVPVSRLIAKIRTRKNSFRKTM